MVRISDSKVRLEDINVGSNPFGLVPIARIEDGDDTVNKSRYSGKQAGSVHIIEGEFDFTPGNLGHTLYMATGDIEQDTWVTLGLNVSDAVVTPSDPTYPVDPRGTGSDSKPNMGMGRVVGDGANSWHQLLSAFEFPRVPLADLQDGASVINNNHYSGKDRFRMVIAIMSADIFTLALATGPNANDDWWDLGGNVIGGGTTGGPMDAEHQVGTKPPYIGVIAGDGKHTAYDPVCVSIINSYVTNAELLDITSDINAGGVNSGGKVQGIIYGAADDLDADPLVNMGVWVAFSHEPYATWSNLDGISVSIEPV